MMEIYHTGVGHEDNPPGRGSGRYGWGTGENPGQHQFNLPSEVEKLKKRGIKESEIAKMFLGEKAKIQDLRAAVTIAKNEEKKANIQKAMALFEKYGNKSEVARRMGLNESSVRSLLNPALRERRDRYTNTAEMLRKVVDEKEIVDIGKFSEMSLGVPGYTKDVAVSMLEKEGYTRAWVKVKQLGTQHETTIAVLAKPGISYGEIMKRKTEIRSIEDYSPDTGKTWWTPEFPTSVDSKRIYIRYKEDGGAEKDGMIELRKGVEDISLGGSLYSQVRIAVDGSHYMKGMAIYSDDIPKGYDIVYNSNKKKGTPMIGDNPNNEVLKRMKVNKQTGEIDRDNPFGALIKAQKEKDGIIQAGGQRHYTDKDGNDRLSPINKLRDEGDWDSWSKNLSQQFLSKQPLKLIKQQIDLTIAEKKAELETIKSLTNPVIRKKMFEDFANGCDANATDLSVRGFKNQAFQVLLPVPGLKDDEIYAPNFDDGDIVALVRYPHGGVFEIPILKVNNRSEAAKPVMKGVSDAVGINSAVAEQLSGADFDGDAALIIPVASNRLKISSKPPLEGLKNFDAKSLYRLPDDAKAINPTTKQKQMGIVTNLITDMTVQGADDREIERAVKHSMVVIDSEKHRLDYKRSERDNDIRSLKEKYQNTNSKGMAGGASTILSKAKSTTRVNERSEVNDINKMTPDEVRRYKEGYIIYHDTGNLIKRRIDNPSKMTPEELEIYKSGKKVYRTTNELRQQEVSKMSLVDDARELVRDPSNEKEMAYANYANTLKSLAREARKEYRSIGPRKVSESAKKTYAAEVKSLKDKLKKAESNNPRERQAQTIGNSLYLEMLASDPDMDHEHRKRAQSIALNKGRAMVGASKERITITDREWEAIQAGAISTDKLVRIVNNSDLDVLKSKAMPRKSTVINESQMGRIKAMSASGMYTQKEIAEALGISVSAVSEVLRGIR